MEVDAHVGRAQFTCDVIDDAATITGDSGSVANLVVPGTMGDHLMTATGNNAFDSGRGD